MQVTGPEESMILQADEASPLGERGLLVLFSAPTAVLSLDHLSLDKED